VVVAGEHFVKGAPVAFEGGAGIDITGGAHLLGNGAQVDVFGAQAPVAVLKVVHGIMAL